jgi:hypothetical protein
MEDVLKMPTHVWIAINAAKAPSADIFVAMKGGVMGIQVKSGGAKLEWKEELAKTFGVFAEGFRYAPRAGVDRKNWPHETLMWSYRRETAMAVMNAMAARVKRWARAVGEKEPSGVDVERHMLFICETPPSSPPDTDNVGGVSVSLAMAGALFAYCAPMHRQLVVRVE